MTSEQTQAFDQLRRLARPLRFRVLADAEGFPTLPGRYGAIEWFDGRSLAVYCNRPRLFQKLWAVPGVRRHQTGDLEMRALLPVEALEQVAAVIRVRRRAVRPMTPERLARLAAGRQKLVNPPHGSDFWRLGAMASLHGRLMLGRLRLLYSHRQHGLPVEYGFELFLELHLGFGGSYIHSREAGDVQLERLFSRQDAQCEFSNARLLKL